MEALFAIIGALGVIAQADDMKRCEAGIIQGDLSGPAAVMYIDNYNDLHEQLYDLYALSTPNLTPTERHRTIMGEFAVANINAMAGQLEYSADNCVSALEFLD